MVLRDFLASPPAYGPTQIKRLQYKSAPSVCLALPTIALFLLFFVPALNFLLFLLFFLRLFLLFFLRLFLLLLLLLILLLLSLIILATILMTSQTPTCSWLRRMIGHATAGHFTSIF